MKAKLIKHDFGYNLVDLNNKWIATSKDDYTHAINLDYWLSLKNCQAIERGYDLYDLFNEVDESIDYHEFDFTSFRLGFQKALSILGNKKFSEEDVKLAIKFGSEDYEPQLDGITERFIQSLQPKEWDVIVETKKVIDETKIVGSVKGVKGSGNKVTTYKSVPKLDADGCLVLKPKSK